MLAASNEIVRNMFNLMKHNINSRTRTKYRPKYSVFFYLFFYHITHLRYVSCVFTIKIGLAYLLD